MRRPAVALLAVAALSAPAAATTLVEAEGVCPIGGETFTYMEVTSTSRQGQRYDLAPLGAQGGQPLPLPECPGNGLILFQEFSEDDIATLTPYVNSPEYRALAATETQYYRAYKLAEHLGAGAGRADMLLLQATWQADGDAYRRYVRELLPRLDQSGAGEAAGSDPWWSNRLLRSELYRRIADFALAATMLDGPEQPETDIYRTLRLQMLELIERRDDRACAIYAEGMTQPSAGGEACWTDTTPGL